MNAKLGDKRYMLLGAAIALQQIFGTRAAAAYLADIGVSLAVTLELLANSGSAASLSADRARGASHALSERGQKIE